MTILSNVSIGVVLLVIVGVILALWNFPAYRTKVWQVATITLLVVALVWTLGYKFYFQSELAPTSNNGVSAGASVSLTADAAKPAAASKPPTAVEPKTEVKPSATATSTPAEATKPAAPAKTTATSVTIEPGEHRASDDISAAEKKLREVKDHDKAIDEHAKLRTAAAIESEKSLGDGAARITEMVKELKVLKDKVPAYAPPAAPVVTKSAETKVEATVKTETSTTKPVTPKKKSAKPKVEVTVKTEAPATKPVEIANEPSHLTPEMIQSIVRSSEPHFGQLVPVRARTRNGYVVIYDVDVARWIIGTEAAHFVNVPPSPLRLVEVTKDNQKFVTFGRDSDLDIWGAKSTVSSVGQTDGTSGSFYIRGLNGGTFFIRNGRLSSIPPVALDPSLANDPSAQEPSVVYNPNGPEGREWWAQMTGTTNTEISIVRPATTPTTPYPVIAPTPESRREYHHYEERERIVVPPVGPDITKTRLP
jgi:hypothetical protein